MIELGPAKTQSCSALCRNKGPIPKGGLPRISGAQTELFRSRETERESDPGIHPILQLFMGMSPSCYKRLSVSGRVSLLHSSSSFSILKFSISLNMVSRPINLTKPNFSMFTLTCVCVRVCMHVCVQRDMQSIAMLRKTDALMHSKHSVNISVVITQWVFDEMAYWSTNY